MAHTNFAYSTIATAPSPAASGVSLVVAAGDGAKFPAVPFNATIWPAAVQPSPTNAEIVQVVAVSTDTFTLESVAGARTRQEGSAARTVIVGDQIAVSVTAALLDMPQTNLEPQTDEYVQAGYSSVAVRSYTVASGKKLAVASGGRLRIL